jgi:chromosome segregation ATPase
MVQQSLTRHDDATPVTSARELSRMTLAMMNTHKAFKALQLAGVSDQQAEAMVEIFTEMQQDNALSRADLMNAGEGIKASISELDVRLSNIELRIENIERDIIGLKTDVSQLQIDVKQLQSDVNQLKVDVHQLKADVSELKTDMRWIKRLLMVMATTMVIAAIKYIFS